MTLVRFQLRNEYGLGKPELYDEATREDPKAVLDGVAVAGLVGILRQLGDLAEFAAEVFHGLQEQVMTTASRSHNLMGRVQRIEAALPPLEKRVLAQTSHIHLAYSAGSDWHARIRNDQHHFIDNDLPRFIMDSYEECRDPPRLHLLDKFDTGGPGSCLRRYSDPTFFRRVSMRLDESNAVKIRKDKKSHKIKKRRSFPKNGEFSRGTSLSKRSSRLQFSSSIANGRASPTISVEDLTFDSGTGDRLNSFDSRSGSGYIECIFNQSDNMQLDERGSNRSSYSRLMQHEDFLDSESASISSSMKKKGLRTSSAQQMQHEDSVVSVSGGEDSASASSSMRKKGSKTSSAQLWQHEDSVGSVSHEEESASASSSLRKKGSKTTSSQPLQHEDSVSSMSHEEERASISSSMRKEGSKAPSIEQMQHEDSVSSLSREEESATTSSSTRKDSKASYTQLGRHDDSLDPVYQGEESTAISVSSHSPPRIASNLSSVAWEERTEITELNEPNIRRDQALESVSAHFNVSGETEDVVATKVDELSSQCNIGDISKSMSNEDLVDDIDSEFDHYVDALNTIESESETDLDYQTKREVEHFLSTAENTKVGAAVEELTSDNVDQQPSNAGSDAASDVSSDKGVTLDLPEAASSEMSTEEQSPQVAGISIDSDCLPGISVSQSYIHNGPKVEGSLHDPSSPDSSPPPDETRMSSSAKHQESTIKLAGVDFWTNGGLLGLQPAKPPVFAPSDTAGVDCNPSVPTSTQKGDSGDKLHPCGNDEASISTKKTTLVSSASYPGSGIESSCHSNHSKVFGVSNGHGMSSITVMAPGSAVPVAPTARVVAAETTKENEENSSGVFGIGHRLFVNSFKKKLSLVYDEKPYLPTTSDVSAVDERDASYHGKVVERISLDQFETLSPVNSSPPSPPLEHMRISFRPVNDFETSKLGLRFSNESNSIEKFSAMFASFQLVPQPAGQLHCDGLDSDDDDGNDTMSQSSPYNSDDCLSNHSESNSEHWESDSHDATGRVSMESASAPTSHRNFKEAEMPQPDDGVGSLHSFPDCIGGPGLNLPNFDSIRSLPRREKNDKPELRNNDLLLQSTAQSTPAPPPLPPTEWRIMKPDADAAEDGQAASQALENATYPNQAASCVQEQAKLNPVRPQNIVEEIVQVVTDREDQQKSNSNKDSFAWVADGKSTNDKDDFLQQIRMKSFNLRRTVTAKPSAPAQAASANVKVTAILEKANAIRQAVGSDDGEDDSWSDT